MKKKKDWSKERKAAINATLYDDSRQSPPTTEELELIFNENQDPPLTRVQLDKLSSRIGEIQAHSAKIMGRELDNLPDNQINLLRCIRGGRYGNITREASNKLLEIVHPKKIFAKNRVVSDIRSGYNIDDLLLYLSLRTRASRIRFSYLTELRNPGSPKVIPETQPQSTEAKDNMAASQNTNSKVDKDDIVHTQDQITDDPGGDGQHHGART